jgi:hypothetical protein
MTLLPEEALPFGSPMWFLFTGLALSGRVADLLSTWIATPRLTLEGNPIARRLGWKWGIPLNLVVPLFLGCQPTLAVAVATTSFLVAARNLQNAWLMRSMGEWQYRLWISERLSETPKGLALACFLGESFLMLLPGAALLLFAGDRLVPMGVGMGMVAYAAAVAFFTSWALLRH